MMARRLAGLAIATYALARAIGATHNRHHARWQWTGTKLALIMAALAVIVAIASSRYHRRKDHKARISQAMGGVLGKKHVEPVTIERARFHKGQLTDVIATHGHHVNSLDRTMRKEMGDVMAAHFNSPVEIEWRPDKSAVRVRRAEPEAPDMSPTGRVRTAVRLAIGAGAQVDNVRYGEDGATPVAFRVSYPATAADAGAEWRKKADMVIQEKTGAIWTSSWQPDADRVTYRLAPVLPTYVPYPADGMPNEPALPLGIGHGGRTVVWDPDSNTPHMLVIGKTGSGKTVVLRALTLGAVRRGFQVSIVDPKRISMRGFVGYPGVRDVATRLEDMIAVVRRTHEEVESRYQRLEAGLVDPEDLTPILLVMDEVTEFVSRARAAHKNAGGRGEAPAVEQFGSLARLAREGRAHLLVGAQRPDVQLFGSGGESRDNFPARVTLGRVSRFAAQMVEVDTQVTSGVRGRAAVSMGGDEAEVQCFWLPDMANRNLSDADRALVDGLRPQRPELHLVTAEDDGADS